MCNFCGAPQTILCRVYACPKLPQVDKPTFPKIFSSSVLFGASWAAGILSIKVTLHMIFSCLTLAALLDNIAQSFYLCNVAQEMVRQKWQHCTWFFQCNVFPNSIKSALHVICSCTMCVTSQSTLYRVFTIQCYSRGFKTTLYSIFLVQCCLEPLWHSRNVQGALMFQEY